MNNLSKNNQTPPKLLRLMRWFGWLMVVGVIVLSLAPLPPMPDTIAGSDKSVHLGSYFFLSYWFFHSYFKQKLTVIAGFLLLGLCLEFLQSLTAYRFLEWLDMLMNGCGVLLAYVVFWQLKIRVKWLLNG